jgi:diguanylate cyclase (GGDEF)-like protein
MSLKTRVQARPARAVNGLLLALVAASLLLFFGPIRALPVPGVTLFVPWWAVAVGFALAEVFVIHVPMARSAHTHTLSEIPSVLALVFLAPSGYLLATLLGSGLALIVVERQKGAKLLFNLAMFALEAGVAILVQHAVLGADVSTGPRGWLAALAAMLVTGLLSCALVTVVVFLAGDGYHPAILREATRTGLLASAANTSLALLIVVLLLLDPLALILLAAVFVVVVVAFRGYVAFAGRYSQLELLYRFVGTVGASVDLDLTVASVLREARSLLGAARAELVVLPGGDLLGRHVVLTEDGLDHIALSPDLGTVWWRQAAQGKSVLALGGEERSRVQLPASITNAMAVPVLIEGAVGVLIVADRLFAGKSFTPQDLRLFEALSGHASVTLHNASLVDAMRSAAAVRDHEARHDPLTGLPNRREFHARFGALAASGEVAVLMLDLDDFKEINDTLGHGAGDHVLREIGRRLTEAPDGMVARLGGDEFVILLTGVPTADRARARAAALLQDIRRPVALDDVNLVVGGSIGIALYPSHGETSDALLTHADVAMYAAKAAGTGVEVYTPEPESGRHRRLALAAQMEAAIASGAITLWYQPKLQAGTGAPVGVEGLVRWIHPVYGLVSPAEILPVAERTGLMRRLTDHLLQTALSQQACWRAAGLDLTVAVNITTRDLLDEKLPLIVARQVRAAGGRPENLTLEITESGIMRDFDRCLAVLDRLALIGVKLSIDDFGTGYSSLAYLERLPVSEVKIDRSFVARLADHNHNATVLQSAISMSHALGLSVVTEGVETQHLQDALTELGADVLQGFHLGRPMPAADVAPWCQTRRMRRPAAPVAG